MRECDQDREGGSELKSVVVHSLVQEHQALQHLPPPHQRPPPTSAGPSDRPPAPPATEGRGLQGSLKASMDLLQLAVYPLDLCGNNWTAEPFTLQSHMFFF